MSRPRSEKIVELKAKLITRIREGFLRPGDRFMSNRVLAARFGVSYQTAHRLSAELCSEGWIERRRASGTYIAGQRRTLTGVQFLFHERAQRAGSFGSRLLKQLCARLKDEKIEHAVSFVRKRAFLDPNLFPVVWECMETVLPRLNEGQYALLLHDLPPAGLAGSFIDTVSTDDFSGGLCAAEIFNRRGCTKAMVLAGPKTDARCVRRVEGFRSLLPDAEVIWSGGWFREDGLEVAPCLFKKKPQALFCCNDRLAEGVVCHYKKQRHRPPEIIGFDDAPIAEALNITTIAIPWDELVEAAMGIVRKRISGNTSTASRQILAPRPVIRR